MRKSDLILLFAYNSWANNRILTAVARLNPDQFTSPNPCTGYGSIQGLLLHILNAEVVWRDRLKKSSSDVYSLEPENFPTLDSLLYRWQQEETVFQDYIEGLNDQQLEESIGYTNRRGETFENIIWNILAHVVNHGTQHRSEVATILTGYGVSPGDLDLIHYLRISITPKEVP